MESWATPGRKQKDLLERALEMLSRKQHFGEDHFEVAVTLTNLGNAYGDLGDPGTTKDLLERALKIEEKHFGEDHFEVASLRLGQRLWTAGRPQQEEGPPRACSQDKRKTLRGGALQGRVYFEPGQRTSSKRALEMGKTLREGALSGRDDVGQPGQRLWKSGRPEEAEGPPRTSPRDRCEQHFGADHFLVAKTLNNLANAYGDLGDPRKQKDLLERALKIKEKHFGEEHFEVATTLYNLALAHGALGDRGNEARILIKVLPIFERHFGMHHENCGLVKTALNEAAEQLTEVDEQNPEPCLGCFFFPSSPWWRA